MKRCFPAPSVWRVVIPRAFVVAMVLFAFQRCAASAAIAGEPPMLLIVEQDTVVYGPAGERIAIPSGTELDMCADEMGMLLRYEIGPMVIRVPVPCVERPLFADGFEEAAR